MARGHHVDVVCGLERLPPADTAILHVDLSVVPDDYARAARRYPRVMNGQALDIRKRAVSRNLVARGDGWRGPVIVKTDLNYRGLPEQELHKRALKANGKAAKPPKPIDYKIYESPERVPHSVWSRPELVVERFLPERDDSGFAVRTWLFLGDRERCRRFTSDKPLVKGANIKFVGSEPSEVPDFVRAERDRLKIDYGKFDFVLHNGEPVLFDANKTPGVPPPSPMNAQLYEYLADGLDQWLPKA